jgi:hypothetical protein
LKKIPVVLLRVDKTRLVQNPRDASPSARRIPRDAVVEIWKNVDWFRARRLPTKLGRQVASTGPGAKDLAVAELISMHAQITASYGARPNSSKQRSEVTRRGGNGIDRRPPVRKA